MGYMGLKHFQESDNASELADEMGNAMADVLRDGLKEAGNSFNTDGVVNVAMIFRDLIIPNKEEYVCNEKLRAVAKETYKKLFKQVHEDKPGDWDDQENRKEHMAAYRGMLKALEKFIA